MKKCISSNPINDSPITYYFKKVRIHDDNSVKFLSVRNTPIFPHRVVKFLIINQRIQLLPTRI